MHACSRSQPLCALRRCSFRKSRIHVATSHRGLTFHVIQDRFAGCRPTNTPLMQINPRPICGGTRRLFFIATPRPTSCVAACTSCDAWRFTDFQSHKKKTRWPKIIWRDRLASGPPPLATPLINNVRERHLGQIDNRHANAFVIIRIKSQLNFESRKHSHSYVLQVKTSGSLAVLLITSLTRLILTASRRFTYLIAR